MAPEQYASPSSSAVTLESWLSNRIHAVRSSLATDVKTSPSAEAVKKPPLKVRCPGGQGWRCRPCRGRPVRVPNANDFGDAGRRHVVPPPEMRPVADTRAGDAPIMIGPRPCIPPPPAAKGAPNMPNVGPIELAIILIIALVVFGPKRLPEVGRSIGEGIRELKDTLRSADPRDEPEQHPQRRA